MSTTDLYRQLAEARDERDALRAILDGHVPAGAAWLMSKVHRQAVTLDRLQRRVEGQRLVLRTLDELGRGLTRDEYLAARNAAAPRLRERTAEDPAEYAAAG